LYDRNLAEARLLRAIFHFDLAGWFGDIPVIGNDENGVPIVFEAGNASAMNMSRTACSEALKWIADECDAVKDILPFRYSNENENWGRVNGAAAYALKSRALLYRASALNNPEGKTDWWQEAAQAAKILLRRIINRRILINCLLLRITIPIKTIISACVYASLKQ
jgi:hypothetical protein